MAKNKNQPSRVEDVLQRIEARERSKGRRKQIIFGILALGGLGAGAFALSSLGRQPQQLPTFQYEELNGDQINGILTSNASEILVSHPDLGTETIRSVADYQRLSETADLARRLEELRSRPEQTDSTQVDSTRVLETFVVDIAGVRRAGETLKFTIEDFDPEVEYLLDLGNGQRRKVNKSFRYRYPLSGNFDVKLLATKDEASSIYEKSIRVNAPLPKEEPRPKPQPEPPAQVAEVAEEEPPEEAEKRESEADPSLFAANEASPLEVQDLQRRNSGNSQPVAPEAAAPVQPAEVEEPAPQASAGPLLSAEEPASFPGGKNAMIRFIRRNYRYPSQASEVGAEGMVIVRFVVNPDGSLSGFRVVRGIGYGCDEEALRIIRNMPRWVPAKQDGEKVAVYQTIPITFRLLE